MNKTPSLQALIYRARATFKSKTGVDNPAIEAFAAAIGGVAFGQYAYADYLFKQMNPETADEEWLSLHAARHKADRIPSFFAMGTANFLQTNGVISIPVGTLVKTSDGKEYQVTSVTNSSEPVPIKAMEPNVVGNLPAGETLYLISAVTGLNPDSIISNAIEGGADLEDVDHWRDRIVLAFNEKQAVGRLTDYEFWAKSAHTDIDYAWGLDNTPLLGQVTVYIGQRENNPILAPQINVVAQNYIDANRLAGCHVFVKTPRIKAVPVIISNVASISVRQNIDVALQAFFNDRLDNRTQLMANEVSTVISGITNQFTLLSPNAPTQFPNDTLLTYGGAQWT